MISQAVVPSSVPELVSKAIERIKRRAETGDVPEGLTTGFSDLDAITDGMQPSQLNLVGSRPSMGKSTFCLNIIRHNLIENDVPTAIFSARDSNKMIVQRMLSSGAQIDSNRLRTGALKDVDCSNLSAEAALLEKSKLFLFDQQCTSEEIANTCRELKSTNPSLRLVFVDKLEMSAESSNDLFVLKRIAEELAVTVIATVQVSRKVESRPNKRPALSDLECGGNARIADIVMCLYRKEYFNPETKKRGEAELIIRKNRLGPTGTIKLKYDGSIGRFSGRSS